MDCLREEMWVLLNLEREVKKNVEMEMKTEEMAGSFHPILNMSSLNMTSGLD